MVDGIVGIYYREVRVLSRKLPRVVLAAAVPPFLYLMAFGFGVGKDSVVQGTDYLSFLLPGLLAMASMNQSYNIATEINISRFYLKIFEEFLLAPVQRWQVLVAEMLYGVTRGMIPVAIIMVYAVLCGIQLSFGLGFWFSLLLHLAAFAQIGFIVALKMKNHRDQASMNAFVITPMMFLSGTFFPVEQMPLLIQWVATLSPLTYSADLLRHALLGQSLDLLSMGILAGLNLALAAVALHTLKRMEP
ncbi:ABC transporter permease [Ferrimonas sp. YFM]|uniref:ABC transporter permease n=1 Tax=Ferrimonas sp. YFM TaxID=3028878 RepID=UPI002573A87F|nr:ABC transporter permease [Ferrimonas sp. YFM]BDY05226.1 transport permease protein [Ferrimonas sp. YFM]